MGLSAEPIEKQIEMYPEGVLFEDYASDKDLQLESGGTTPDARNVKKYLMILL
jgi:hypothetical protein